MEKNKSNDGLEFRRNKKSTAKTSIDGIAAPKKTAKKVAAAKNSTRRKVVEIKPKTVVEVEKVEDVVNIGDELEVKVCEIDAQGRINLIRNDIEYAAGSDFSRRDGNRRPLRRTSNHD